MDDVIVALRGLRDLMTQSDDRRDHVTRSVLRPPRRKPTRGFDLWLSRGLHQMFDDVAKEPIPSELLKLIEDDKHK